MTEAVLQIAPLILNVRHLPSPMAAEPLVLLHGWGADSTVFSGFSERMAQSREVILVDLPGFGGSEAWPEIDSALFYEMLLETLSNQLPEQFNLLGWSLGGMVATAFCERFPQRVIKLITLSSNACFVANSEWHTAMPEKIFRQFCDFFAAQPETCLKQFIGLEAQGDSQQRQLIKKLRSVNTVQTNHNWHQLLALLGEIDNRTALGNLTVPGLHLFGEHDALVPVAAASEIAALNTSQKVDVLADTCHVLHLSAAEKVAEKINQFLSGNGGQPERLDKQQVAESFSRAAESYDGAAAFQRKIADQVLARIPADSSPDQVLDVGCGTGYLSAGVRNTFTNTHLTSLDLASGMLAYAQAQRPVADRWVCGDAESLPLPENSFDLIVSSLAYQWCEHPERWGAELRRVLKEGGTAVFSTFGPSTLTELSSAWQSADDFVHVNRFIEVEQLRRLLTAAGLRCELVVEKHQLLYPNLKSLMRELKAIGAHNVNTGRNEGMTGRERLRKLTEAYEQFRHSDGQLPASYEVIHGVVKREM